MLRFTTHDYYSVTNLLNVHISELLIVSGGENVLLKAINSISQLIIIEVPFHMIK